MPVHVEATDLAEIRRREFPITNSWLYFDTATYGPHPRRYVQAISEIADRLSTDPLGTLESENIIKAGGGSQTGSLHRWGDYTAMAIDPGDDCSFFYTNEYLKSTGSFNWSTWIASFKFPGCV